MHGHGPEPHRQAAVETPTVRSPFGQPPPLQPLQSSDEIRSRRHQGTGTSGCRQLAVEGRHCHPADVGKPLLNQVNVEPRSQDPGDDFLRLLPDTGGDQPGRNEQVLAVGPPSPDQDVGVRIVSVVMINGQPFEPGSEPGLKHYHDLSEEGPEVAKRCAVFGADDHPEVARVFGPACGNRFRIHRITRPIVECEVD